MIDTAASVRSATVDDVKSIGEIAEASGLFPAAILPEMISAYISGAERQVWSVVEYCGKVAGFAFAEPERLTDRTWNLRAIGVDPARRRLGLATALLEGVEAVLRVRKARLVVIETTDGDDQRAARAFYPTRGYEENAHIPDFREAGMGKLIFCKQLPSRKDRSRP